MTISLDELRKANFRRDTEYPGSSGCDLGFRTVEFAGEAGEVCDAIKKYLRHIRGIKGSTASHQDIADEMADVLITLDLLAMELGINLSEALILKFNRTSEKLGLDTTLPLSK